MSVRNTDTVAAGAPAVCPTYRVPLHMLRPPVDAGTPWIWAPPSLAQPCSQLCTAEQFAEPLFLQWCEAIRIRPVKHRKHWEFAWVLAAIKAAGLLQPGRRGVGFGVGREPLVSVMAALGLQVTATDISAALPEAATWVEAQQHAADLVDLHHAHLIGDAQFAGQVSFRQVDMRSIPPDLRDFDFCWSLAVLPVLGSIDAAISAVEQSLKTLRPGGLAVHTLELNIESDIGTLQLPTLSLFRKCDIEILAA